MLLSQLFELAKSKGEPTGTYAGVRFSTDTVDALKKLQKDLGVPEPLASEDFHTTLLYSKKYLPDYEAAGELSPVQTSDDEPFTLDLWPTSSGKKTCCVLKYRSAWLEKRHKSLMEEHGATWDHPDYIPHITLSYNVGDWKPESMKVAFGTKKPIVISEEYQEDLDKDW